MVTTTSVIAALAFQPSCRSLLHLFLQACVIHILHPAVPKLATVCVQGHIHHAQQCQVSSCPSAPPCHPVHTQLIIVLKAPEWLPSLLLGVWGELFRGSWLPMPDNEPAGASVGACTGWVGKRRRGYGASGSHQGTFLAPVTLPVSTPCLSSHQ